MIKRVYVTLLELLLVCTLVMAVVSVVGFNATKMLRHHRFEASASILLEKLQLAQDLMLTLKTDVKVKIEKSSDRLYLHIDVEKQLSKPAESLLKLELTVLNISGIGFVDDSGLVHEDKIELLFLSNGSKMSKGVLHLLSSKAKEEKSIVLAGYPAPIQFGSKSPLEQNDENHLLYPQEVYEQAK